MKKMTTGDRIFLALASLLILGAGGAFIVQLTEGEALAAMWPLVIIPTMIACLGFFGPKVTFEHASSLETRENVRAARITHRDPALTRSA